jgi:uncharacterized protein YecE (DUF72 family)
VRVGVAGWSNPPSERYMRLADRSHLVHYAAVFNCVEINSSFYRSHQRATYERWRQSTPPRFRFAVKLPRTVTHESALQHCSAELRQFLGEVAGLGSKLHVARVQLPPSLVFEPAVAARFFKSLTAACTCRIVCEPRHASWFSARAEAALSRYEVSRAAADPTTGDADAASPGGSKRLVYYRLHGSPRKYYSAHSAEYLQQLAARLQQWRTQTRDVWCVFDNTARYAAWPNARHLLTLVR